MESVNMPADTIDKAHSVRQSREGPRQIVLVFQGGGALGAYQAGVYQALHEAGIEPDWVIGTSIGAINATLIAGNEAENRLERLQDFWRRMERGDLWGVGATLPGLSDALSHWTTVFSGVPGFFEPNAMAFMGAQLPLGADRAGYYSTAPLRKTLLDLVDFSRLGRSAPRLTIGTAEVRTSKMRYFDSRDGDLTVNHVLASGALPPAFPAVRIEGELYWDGGILSNTPVEAVLDDNPRQNSLIFAIHMWNPDGAEPETIQDVLHRYKDIQYASRVASHINRQRQVHRLRHVINELVGHLSQDQRDTPAVRELAAFGCVTRMHIVRLLAPALDNESHTKDIDFSKSGIRKRWEAGHANTRRVLAQAPWEGTFDPLEGAILHEPMSDPVRVADLNPEMAST